MSTAKRLSSEPISLQEAIRQEAAQLFTGLKPEVAEACRREYARGRLEVLQAQQGVRPIESGKENSPSANTSSEADTRPPSSPPSRMNRLPASSPLVRLVSQQEVAEALTQLGFRFGHVLNAERTMAMCSTLQEIGWTAGEIREAVPAISSDPELARQVGFERTIGPAVFAMAKEHHRVKRGRLHTHADVRQMCEDRGRPLHEIADVVHVEQRGEDGEMNVVPMWRLK